MSVEKNTLLNFSNSLIIHLENTKEINVTEGMEIR